jgi:short-subunit dehydrogenase
MSVNLKQLKDQVVVLTGASSGIGLTTARMAAKRGAKLVLAARNEEALRQVVEEIRGAGGQAEYVVADVGREDEVNEIARVAQERFGGFDTWINNAGGGIFGLLLEHTMADSRRLFDTNFWGMVHGSLTAARHLMQRGGAIINVGSVVSDRAMPLQGMYSSSKHAVKGFTDTLRMELEMAKAPISVTLIKPTSIDTPFPQHARNYLDEEPSLPAPVYAPEIVAEAILHCAETPKRDVLVGGAAKVIATLGNHAPRVTDKLLESPAFVNQEKSGQPPRQPEGALYAPTFGLKERGEYPGMVRQTSAYTQASLHPAMAAALLVGAGLMVSMLANRNSSNGNGSG